jgi:hypothetical protein
VVEHRFGKAEAEGSIPSGSTTGDQPMFVFLGVVAIFILTVLVRLIPEREPKVYDTRVVGAKAPPRPPHGMPNYTIDPL